MTGAWPPYCDVSRRKSTINLWPYFVAHWAEIPLQCVIGLHLCVRNSNYYKIQIQFFWYSKSNSNKSNIKSKVACIFNTRGVYVRMDHSLLWIRISTSLIQMIRQLNMNLISLLEGWIWHATYWRIWFLPTEILLLSLHFPWCWKEIADVESDVYIREIII